LVSTANDHRKTVRGGRELDITGGKGKSRNKEARNSWSIGLQGKERKAGWFVKRAKKEQGHTARRGMRLKWEGRGFKRDASATLARDEIRGVKGSQ